MEKLLKQLIITERKLDKWEEKCPEHYFMKEEKKDSKIITTMSPKTAKFYKRLRQISKRLLIKSTNLKIKSDVADKFIEAQLARVRKTLPVTKTQLL